MARLLGEYAVQITVTTRTDPGPSPRPNRPPSLTERAQGDTPSASACRLAVRAHPGRSEPSAGVGTTIKVVLVCPHVWVLGVALAEQLSSPTCRHNVQFAHTAMATPRVASGPDAPASRPQRGLGHTQLDDKDLCNLYLNGAASNGLAIRFGVSARTIRRILQRNKARKNG